MGFDHASSEGCPQNCPASRIAGYAVSEISSQADFGHFVCRVAQTFADDDLAVLRLPVRLAFDQPLLGQDITQQPLMQRI